MVNQHFRQILTHIEKIPYMAELKKDDKMYILTEVIRQYHEENKQVENLPEHVISLVRSHYTRYINHKVDMLDKETSNQVASFSEGVLLKQGYTRETVKVAIHDVFLYIKTKYVQLELTRELEETKQKLLAEYILELVRCGTLKEVSLRYSKEKLANLLFKRFSRNQSLVSFNFKQHKRVGIYVPSYDLTAFQKEKLVKQFIQTYLTLNYETYLIDNKCTLDKFSKSFDQYILQEMETHTKSIIQQIQILLQKLTTAELVRYANNNDTRYKNTLNSNDFYFKRRVSEKYKFMCLAKINTMKPLSNQIQGFGLRAIEECQKYFIEKDLTQYSNNLIYIRSNSYEYRTLLEQIRNIPQNTEIFTKADILYKGVTGLIMLVDKRRFYLTPVGIYELTVDGRNIKHCVAEYNQKRFDRMYYINKVKQNVKEQKVADILINWLRFIFVEVKKG